MVRRAAAGNCGLPGDDAEVSANARPRAQGGRARDHARRGLWLRGRLRARARGLVLSTARMNRILEIHDGDFVARVQPGGDHRDLQDAARRKGLFYPPDPASLKDCSIGGNIATNAGGPRCLKIRRHAQLRARPRGRARRWHGRPDGRPARTRTRPASISSGFSSAPRDCSVSSPRPRCACCRIRPPVRRSRRDLRTCAPRRRRSPPLRARVSPRRRRGGRQVTLDAARKYKPGAKFPPGNAHLLPRWMASPRACEARFANSAKLLAGTGATEVQTATTEAASEKNLGSAPRFSFSLKATGLKKLNEDIVVPRGRLVDLVKFAQGLQKRSGFPIACFGHAGDGNIHVNIMVGDYTNPSSRARRRGARRTLRASRRMGRGDHRRTRHRSREETLVANRALEVEPRFARHDQARARSGRSAESRKIYLITAFQMSERGFGVST